MITANPRLQEWITDAIGRMQLAAAMADDRAERLEALDQLGRELDAMRARVEATGNPFPDSDD